MVSPRDQPNGFPAWLIEAWGRKPTCVLTLLGSAAAYFYGHAASLAQLIGFGLCMQFFLFGMWSVLYAYTPELYPTRARATGAGCASAIGRVGSLIGPPAENNRDAVVQSSVALNRFAAP